MGRKGGRSGKGGKAAKGGRTGKGGETCMQGRAGKGGKTGKKGRAGKGGRAEKEDPAETGGGGGNCLWSHLWSLWALPGGQWTSNDRNVWAIFRHSFDNSNC